jgi:hypothetical protein
MNKWMFFIAPVLFVLAGCGHLDDDATKKLASCGESVAMEELDVEDCWDKDRTIALRGGSGRPPEVTPPVICANPGDDIVFKITGGGQLKKNSVYLAPVNGDARWIFSQNRGGSPRELVVTVPDNADLDIYKYNVFTTTDGCTDPYFHLQ